MRIRTLLAGSALLLLLLAPRPARSEGEAQGDEKRTAANLPARYADCLDPKTIDVFLSAPANQWGLAGDLAKTGHDHLYGIQLCRSTVEDTPRYCRQFGDIKGLAEHKAVAKMGRDCAIDAEFFLVHAALRAGSQAVAATPEHPAGPAGLELHCQRWCERELGRAFKKVDCGEFCKKAIPLMPDHAAEACKIFVDRTAPFYTEEPDYARTALPLCLMQLDPSPANCKDLAGPYELKLCKDRSAVLAAMRQKDPKRCPKDLHYGAVCAALTAPEGGRPEDACDKAARAFLEPFCKARRDSGGMREDEATKTAPNPDAW